ncbi:MAG: hypothetical protein LBI77_01435 [Puniceicoccales bacterium]|jgi:hypothetical protein|nr:hypothetical protein [Puniceicoccales bacterium]
MGLEVSGRSISYWEAANTINDKGNFFSKIGTVCNLFFRGLTAEQESIIRKKMDSESNISPGSDLSEKSVSGTNSQDFKQFGLDETKIDPNPGSMTELDKCKAELDKQKKDLNNEKNQIENVKTRIKKLESLINDNESFGLSILEKHGLDSSMLKEDSSLMQKIKKHEDNIRSINELIEKKEDLIKKAVDGETLDPIISALDLEINSFSFDRNSLASYSDTIEKLSQIKEEIQKGIDDQLKFKRALS